MEKKLIELKLSGKHLSHFGQNILAVAGMKDENLSAALVSSMNILVQRYSSEFHKLWADIEVKWMEWTAEDLTEWLKYQSLHLESGVIDWSQTCDLLVRICVKHVNFHQI